METSTYIKRLDEAVASLNIRIEQLQFDVETDVEQLLEKVKAVIDELGELQSVVDHVSEKLKQIEAAHESDIRETNVVLGWRIIESFKI